MPKQKLVELFQAAQAAEASSSAHEDAGLLAGDLSDCEFQDGNAGPKISEARAAVGESTRAIDSSGLPGLDQHQGGISLSFEPQGLQKNQFLQGISKLPVTAWRGGWWSDPDPA
jgi:hypothetical protein